LGKKSDDCEAVKEDWTMDFNKTLSLGEVPPSLELIRLDCGLRRNDGF
jgi:hypothetical protein